MSIRYKCAKCGAVMKIKEELAGTKGHCPQCRDEFVVPGKESETGEDPKTEAESPTAEEPAPAEEGYALAKTDDTELPPLSLPPLDEEPEPEPAPKSASKPASSKKASKPADSEEDEWQKILMGEGDDKPKSGAKKPKAFEPEDEPVRDLGEELKKPASKSSVPSSKGQGPSTAEISAALMKKKKDGDAPPKLDSSVTNYKTGRAFGDEDKEQRERRVKATADAAKHYARQMTIIAVAVVIVGGLGWWMMQPSRGHLPPLAYVSGKVTWNGSPLKGATVKFSVITEGNPGGGAKAKDQKSDSIGVTNDSGDYVLYYVQDVPGAVVGKHFVWIQAQNENGVDFLPEKYNAKSELSKEVKSGSNTGMNFELTN